MDLKTLIKLAEDQDWEVSRTKRQHVRFRSPAGRSYFTSKTASDHRSYKNFLSELKRDGLVVDRYGRKVG